MASMIASMDMPYCFWRSESSASDISCLLIPMRERSTDEGISSEKFKIDRNFDATSYFNECFGVAPNFEVPLQKVVLRAYNTEQYYMRDLPVHPTQRLIAEGDGYCDYEVTLRPSVDFLGYLLSRAQWVEIISPQEVRDHIISMVDNIKNRYNKSQKSMPDFQ